MKENIIAICYTLIVLIVIIFSVPPIGHIFYKWSDYWNATTYSPPLTETPDSWKRQDKANNDCLSRAEKLLSSTHLYAYASSTAESYETYDCYAVKFTKIPKI